MNVKIRQLLPLVCLTTLTFIASCNNQVVEEPPPVEVVVAQPEPPGTKPELIEEWDTYTGQLDPKDFVKVYARVTGHILEVTFEEGTEVDAGKVLFQIDPEPYKATLEKAQGELITWQSKLDHAEKTIALYKPLEAKGTVSKEDMLKAVASKGEAIGAIGTAKGKIRDAELDIGYCTVTSPIYGKVGAAALTKGNLVSSTGADSLLTTIAAVDPMYVNFNVNETAYQKYREILKARAKKDPNSKAGTLKIPVQLAIGSGKYEYNGFVDFVDNRVDPTTGSIKVCAKFDNPKSDVDDRRPLTAGSFARIRVSLGDPRPAILVAERAILTDQSLKYVLVVNKDKKNLVERVDVVASARRQQNGLVEIMSGLKGPEWVIVDGVNRTRPGAKVDPKAAEKMPRRPEVK